MGRAFPILKNFYYLDHFLEMIAFVERHYSAILGEVEREYIADFRSLGQQAQGLKVRMANRKGSVFRLSALRYAEIEDCGLEADALERKGFLRKAGEGDFRRLLESLTAKELAAMLRLNDSENPRVYGLKKSQLLQLCSECCGLREIPDIDSFVVLGREATLAFLIFLYFGKKREGLQAFALRDLGIVKTRSEQRSFEVRFKDRADADCAFFYANMAESVSVAADDGLGEISDGIGRWPSAGGAKNRTLRDNELNRLGARLERAGLSSRAFGVYRESGSHPARERMCRIAFSRGEKDSAKGILEQIIADPFSDEELLFAEDFHERKFGVRKCGKLTEMLRKAPIVRIDEAFKDSAERAAMARIEQSGAEVYFTENHLWRTLFGVLFWEEIHNSDTQNEFDLRPTQLFDGRFASEQRDGILRKFGMLRVGAAGKHISMIFRENFGTANGVFRWKRSHEELLLKLAEYGNCEAIIKVLQRIISDFRRNLKGYPDLMIVENGQIHFVEIKAEGDQIQRHQLVQMEALKEAGFDVDVVRVEWHVDPDQEYVVVDIETTGGRSEYHRVTEIGAVKVRRNEIVGRFTTLLNPGRSIPRNIEKLTGITDEMVKDAPKFAEIADEFREFVGEAVFVAHSASFDYGFLRGEYLKLGERFRCPTLCTVVAMRKFFPGLPSYGLGALTKEFQIPLATHHRAMCDAEATAELLKLINGKRLGAGTDQNGLGQDAPATTSGF